MTSRRAYHKRWRAREYHKSLKQNAGLERIGHET